MKMNGNSSYGYQILDLSKHSETQYVVGAEVDKLVNHRNFTKLKVIPSSIYEVEMVNSEVEHQQYIFVGSFGTTWNVQCCNFFFQLFCDPQKPELIEMDTDSLYMVLSEKRVDDLIGPEMNYSGRWMEGMIVKKTLELMNITNFSQETVVSSIGNSIRGHLISSKRNLDVLRWFLFDRKINGALMNRGE